MNLNSSFDKPIRILLIILAALVAHNLVKLILQRFQQTIKRVPSESLAARKARIKTLLGLIRTTSFLAINFAALLMILSELGLDIIPLLTGVGFIGLAFGFGARSLAADLIAGFFILLENQFNVGDEVQLAAGAQGKVKKITLRTVTLKDEEGKIYLIPNSIIKTVVKFPKKLKKKKPSR